jgi:hypothetical protein
MDDEDAGPALTRNRRELVLTAGGPFYRVLRRLRLRTETGVMRCWWLGVALWIPLIVGGFVRFLMGLPRGPVLLDLSVHIRLLFTLPVLLLAEPLLDRAVQSAMRSMYRGQYCDPVKLDDIERSAERLRDSWRVELALLVVAITGGQLVLWRVIGSTGAFHGGETVEFWSFPRVWYAVVALPLVQFVMFRWMWRWIIWSYMLARISRLRLFLLATHTDLACGLSALTRPVSGFSGFVLALGALLSAAWSNKLIRGHASLPDLVPMLVVFLLTALALSLGPLLLLSAHLFRARRQTIAWYGDLFRRYTLDFHSKWIVQSPRPAESLLGSPDMQSLNDLGQAYEVAGKTRPFVFGPRLMFTVSFAGIVPMLPLLLQTVTFEAVLKRIIGLVLGGLPF